VNTLGERSTLYSGPCGRELSRREVNIIFQTLYLQPNMLRGQGQPRGSEQSRREVSIIVQTLGS
jgi:hypothetical protein